MRARELSALKIYSIDVTFNNAVLGSTVFSDQEE